MIILTIIKFIRFIEVVQVSKRIDKAKRFQHKLVFTSHYEKTCCILLSMCEFYNSYRRKFETNNSNELRTH